jgi:hypothetical protein
MFFVAIVASPIWRVHVPMPGYGLADLRAFDAFPMTHHVETVVLLQ